MSVLTTFHADIKNILDQAICYTVCSKLSLIMRVVELFNVSMQSISLHLKNLFQDCDLHGDSVVKESFTTAANGNLSEFPTGSKNLKQWGPCHG
jgi:hypothetical protein